MTKQLRSSLIVGFALAVTLSVVGGAALDPPPPVETAAPTATATPSPTPTPTGESEGERTAKGGEIDLAKIQPNEEIAISWYEMGCFNHRALHIRVSGANPDVAVISELDVARGVRPTSPKLEPAPGTITRTVELPFTAEDRAGVAKWLTKLRNTRERRCTSVIDLQIIKVTTVDSATTEVHESLSDGTCDGTSEWVVKMMNAFLTA